jgi:hypothetical protein
MGDDRRGDRGHSFETSDWTAAIEIGRDRVPEADNLASSGIIDGVGGPRPIMMSTTSTL